MGKSYRDRRDHDDNESIDNRVVYIHLDEIYVSDATWHKLMTRDGQQIEAYRQAYENGEEMVRVVLRPRYDGGYNVKDGRHRVIAAKQAGVGHIEAIIIGSIG